MSNINYVFGNTIRIYRLLNEGDIKSNKIDTFLNISEIKIYDNMNNIINVNPANVTASSIYNGDRDNYGPQLAVDNNISIVDHTNFYHSANDDNEPWIQIKLDVNVKISKIKIYRRPGYDRITNAYVRIKNSNDEVLSDDKINFLSDNYIFGNTIRIYRLQNEGDIKSGGTDTYLNIAEIKIYDDKNELHVINSSNILSVTASSIYGTIDNYGPLLAIDTDINVNAPANTRFYHSATGDNAPWIQIKLKQNIKISRIKIYRRPGYDRITNAYVKIENSDNEVLSNNKINNFQEIETTIIPDNLEITIIPVNIYCNNFSSKCFTGMNAYNISTINQKVKGIIQKVKDTDTLINNLFKDQFSYSQHILDLNSMSIKVLSAINNSLSDEVKKLPPMPEIVRIKEPFTNSNSNRNTKKNINRNSNSNMNQNSVFSSINSNDVSQYGKTRKDKHIEKFACFIQPKLNIYEKFGDWKSDANSNNFDLEYIAPSNNKNLNRYKITSVIPVIKKTNMEQDLNETTAKILAINMNQKSNILINNWKKM
jgi:hypothetical protein